MALIGEEIQPYTNSIRVWIGRIIAVVVLAALAVGVYEQKHTLGSALLDTPYWIIGLIASTTLAAWLVNTSTQYVVLRALGQRVSFRLLLALHVGGGLINHLPARLGTVYRAHYLKQRSGLPYTRFGSLTFTNTLLYLFTTATLTTIALVVEYGLRKSAAVLAILLVAFAVATLALLVCRLPAWLLRFRIGRTIQDLLAGRNLVVGEIRVLLMLLLAHGTLFLLNALRMSGAFLSIDLDLPLAGSMVLGAMRMLSLVVEITPAGLGIQEFLVAATSTLLGIAFAAGFAAAAVTRAIVLALYVLLGLPSLAWLRLSN